MSESGVKNRVRERDGYACVDCGRERRADERKLHVHRLIPDSKYTVDGCVTVCSGCHGKRHSDPTLADRPRPKPCTLDFRLNHELKLLVEKTALEQCLIGGMGEYVVRLLAAHFDRPDLARVPRAKRGPKENGHRRPRKKDMATAS